jgi:outer membrane protein W
MSIKKTIGFAIIAAMAFMTVADNSVRAADEPVAKVENCPKKISVVVETVKPARFLEYQLFSGQGLAEVVAVKSPVAGMLSDVKVSEGSLVDLGQELLVLKAGTEAEIKKLEAAATQAKKVLAARQGWKEKSEKAIQSAEKSYQEAVDRLNEKKARVVKSPVAGIARQVMGSGSEVAADAVLLEISNPRLMIFKMPLADGRTAAPAIGDRFSGMAVGSDNAIEAEVVAVSEGQVIFQVQNDENQVKEGVNYTFKKLLAEHDDAIAIPTKVIQNDSLGDFVYVAEKNKAKKLYVTLGAAADDKTKVEKGLIVDSMLIVSGLECLIDGKKIRIVNPEELAKEKSEPQAKEEKKVVVKKEKKSAEPKIKAEKSEKTEAVEATGKKQITIGLTFERFYVNDKNLKNFYPNSFKHIPGLEASYPILDKVDVWASGKLYSDKQSFEDVEDAFKFSIIPVSVGLRFRPVKFGSFEPFVGAGINAYFYSEKVNEELELENTNGMALGFHFQGGTYYCFSRSFLKGLFPKTNLSLLGELFLKYNIVNKTLAEMTPDETDKFDLGGMEMGIGLAVKF